MSSNTKIPRSLKKNSKKPFKSSLHLPRGSSAYARAKKAEYQHRDLEKAEAYYKEAIHTGDRASSAIKDLASLLHQQGRTSEACSLLESYMHSNLEDYHKFHNLYSTLHKQIASKGKGMIRSLKISGLEPYTS